MKAIENWNGIREAGDFESPQPGAYIARMIQVEDVEDKQYLRVEWDFAEGAYEGANRETFERAGFWPMVFIRSYKAKALGFFKAFITAVETSNPDWRFDPERPDPAGLAGRRVGVVLGKEEYVKRTGEVGERLYVYQVRSVEAVQKGDFKIPALKKLESLPGAWPRAVDVYPSPGETGDWEDGKVPF